MRPLFKTLLVFTALLVLINCQAENTPQEVDLTKRANIPQRNGTVRQELVLKVAIGAMISPKETIKYYGQLADFIGKKMGKRIELIQRKTYSEVNELIRKQEVDIAFVCSGPYVEGREAFGMEAIAVPLVNGKPYYYAYFIVRKGSGIKKLEDLKGRTFAFTDPLSNTGALVPKYILSRMGYSPEGFFSKVIYTYSHDNSILAVSKALVDGASVDSLIYDYYKKNRPGFVSKTEVIYRSEPYGIPPVVVPPNTPRAIKTKLKEVLFNMHKDPEGKKILMAINIDRFAEPDERIYESVRKMNQWLKDQKR
ncbi:MAG: phosphate/phosphite/phosphonate ABC transporter substrate-binding protein [Nitrospirae bacterium]|nr:MAG: phosphate/phosphite/phosphonate ABC transporter substrate-binding protein [Nitrospirota bacterium]